MAKPAPRELDVIRSAYVTPHMLRVTLGGENIATLPEDQASAYVKLIFPQPAEARPLMRTYTIRQQRKDEIDIDFMIHDEAGPASGWAQTTRPGDRILVGGPGARKLINPDADWFVLAGDMTALPAISVNIELLPENARGYAVIEVLDERDIQDLPKPAGFDIHWVVNPKPDSSRSVILERLQQLPASSAICVNAGRNLNRSERPRRATFTYPAIGKWAAAKISTSWPSEKTLSGPLPEPYDLDRLFQANGG